MDQQALDEEFAVFARAAWPRLIHAANLLTHDAHEADDLVQTALTAACARWVSIRRAHDVHAYVRRSLVNAYLDRWRRHRRLLFVATSDDRRLDTVVDDQSDAVADRSQATELLAKLTRRERAVVVMRYYLDMSQTEVASALGVTVGTVATTTSRSLTKMRVQTHRPVQESVR